VNFNGNGTNTFMGSVSIGGYDAHGYKLSVNGNIRAKEIKVEATNWPDYVFTSEHKLSDLKEVENFIQKNQHLPGIPSASEIQEKGLNVGEINAALLKKIEELTLYVIELKKEVETLKTKNQ
ncbi:hypothetical protein DDR33_25295, partial [Pararcticibacter amylolyticus]